MSDKGNAWLVGFIEKCADAGLNVQEIETLIKLSAQDRLFEDPNFSAGFEEKLASEGLDKEALWGKLLGGALAAYGGIKGLQGVGEQIREWRNAPRTAEDRMRLNAATVAEAQTAERKGRAAFNKDWSEMDALNKQVNPVVKKRRSERDGPARYRPGVNPWIYTGR